MKIVAFEGQGGPRLGVVDGDQVVDLQAADPRVPRDLGEWLAKNNGETGTLGEIAKLPDEARALAQAWADKAAARQAALAEGRRISAEALSTLARPESR